VILSTAERRLTMVYEIRTYQLEPGSVGEVEKRFGEAYEYRKKYSPLAAFWHSEIGPLNEIVHVWPYADLAERDRVRKEAAKEANWPPKIAEFILHMSSEVLVPFDFLPPIQPGKVGPIFELRYYGMKAGTAPELKPRCLRASSSHRWSRRACASSGRPTASSTSGPTRAWTGAPPSGTKRGRRASGRPRVAVTRFSPRPTRSCCPLRSRRSSSATMERRRGTSVGSSPVAIGIARDAVNGPCLSSREIFCALVNLCNWIAAPLVRERLVLIAADGMVDRPDVADGSRVVEEALIKLVHQLSIYPRRSSADGDAHSGRDLTVK
jgi:hypothetical protein